MSSADLRAAVRRRVRALRDALVSFVQQRPELAAAVIFGLALLLAASVAMSAEAGASLTVDVAVDPADVKEAQDCEGTAIPLPTKVPPCLVLVGHDDGKVLVKKIPPARATLAGTSTRRRAVYAQTANGRRGEKLGEVAVGTVSKPDGITCDLTDTFTAGSLRYARVTDPRVSVTLHGYATGCAQ